MQNKYKLDNIEIAGKVYPLGYLSSAPGHKSYPQVMVNDKPIISVEIEFGKATEYSLRQAEIAINSFIASNERYAYLPGEVFDAGVPKNFLDCISKSSLYTVDQYLMLGVEQVVIESKQYDENWFRFAVYDKSLCNKFLLLKHLSYNGGLSVTNNLMDELEAIILKCSMMNLPLDSREVNLCIKNIQDLIGQKYGDFAGLYFSNLEEKWEYLSHKERERQLKIYTKSELHQLIFKQID